MQKRTLATSRGQVLMLPGGWSSYGFVIAYISSLSSYIKSLKGQQPSFTSEAV